MLMMRVRDLRLHERVRLPTKPVVLEDVNGQDLYDVGQLVPHMCEHELLVRVTTRTKRVLSLDVMSIN